MKKTILMALLIIASATVTTATAGKKDKKKKGNSTMLQPVELTNGIDSLSYALGMSQSMGLKKYLATQLKVDTTYIDAFCKGLLEVANTPITDEESAYFAGHAIGLQVVKSMVPTMETEIKAADESLAINRNAFLSAFLGGVKGEPTLMTKDKAETFSRSKMSDLRKAAEMKVKKEGEDFLAENAKKDGVVVLPSGLQYKVLKQGTGAVAKADDKVRVIYEGRLIDGTVFDGSAKHDDNGVVFQPKQVIKGWTEALTMMPVGSKWQLFIPQELAYGQRGAGKDIKPYSTLIFDVEVIGIENEK